MKSFPLIFLPALLLFAGCLVASQPKVMTVPVTVPVTPATMPATKPVPPEVGYKDITAAQWSAEVLQSKDPVLVEFGSTHCLPCRAMTPVLKSLGRDFKVRRLDVDQCKELATSLGINYVPTFYVYSGGRQTWAHTGVVTEMELARALGVGRDGE